METPGQDSVFTWRSPGSLFPGICIQPCCLTEWKGRKIQKIPARENLSLSKMFVRACRRSQLLVEISPDTWMFVFAAERFCSELRAAVGLQAGCRCSCLTVRRTESDVSSIFQEDKRRRHDPNVKWPGRKASACSTDKTLADKLREQLWRDDWHLWLCPDLVFPYSTSIRK